MFYLTVHSVCLLWPVGLRLFSYSALQVLGRASSSLGEVAVLSLVQRAKWSALGDALLLTGLKRG